MRPWFLVALASLYLWCCAAQEHIDWLKRLSESPVQDVDELLRDASIVNILVTGATGAAKSSLINSIRRMKDYEPGAAAVDVRECTSEVVKYPSSDGSVVYHDVPGVGTLNWPKSSYLYDIQVDTFDVFLVVKAADRTTETDVWLVEQLISLHKTVYVVNTKIDELLQNKKRSLRPGEFNKDTELKRNREATDGEFQRRGISFSQSAGVQLFQVSSKCLRLATLGLPAVKSQIITSIGTTST
jgi:predicted GTPase